MKTIKITFRPRKQTVVVQRPGVLAGQIIRFQDSLLLAHRIDRAASRGLRPRNVGGSNDCN